jgi:hypothetical protein
MCKHFHGTTWSSSGRRKHQVTCRVHIVSNDFLALATAPPGCLFCPRRLGCLLEFHQMFTNTAHTFMQGALRHHGAAVQRKTAVWTLTSSTYFNRRKSEAESRDFGDMAPVYLQQFDVDWERVVVKERFVAMVGRSDKRLLATNREELQRGACLTPPAGFAA